jgi:hypothetical protein
MSVDKSGGDVLQANAGSQDSGNLADITSASASGNAFLDGASGDSFADSMADQATRQALEQANMGIAGDGGDDNIQANSSIHIG